MNNLNQIYLNRRIHQLSFSLLSINLLATLISCNQASTQKGNEASEIKLAIVGQSLIKVDPRKHYA